MSNILPHRYVEGSVFLSFGFSTLGFPEVLASPVASEFATLAVSCTVVSRLFKILIFSFTFWVNAFASSVSGLSDSAFGVCVPEGAIVADDSGVLSFWASSAGISDADIEQAVKMHKEDGAMEHEGGYSITIPLLYPWGCYRKNKPPDSEHSPFQFLCPETGRRVKRRGCLLVPFKK